MIVGDGSRAAAKAHTVTLTVFALRQCMLIIGQTAAAQVAGHGEKSSETATVRMSQLPSPAEPVLGQSGPSTLHTSTISSPQEQRSHTAAVDIQTANSQFDLMQRQMQQMQVR